jgi:hypothetical protein
MGFRGTVLPRAVSDVAGDDYLRLGIVNTIAQSGMAEAGVHDGMDGPKPRARQHGDHALQGERHINDDAIALADPERLQAVGEAANLAVKLAIGDDALGAVLAQPNEGGAVAAVGMGMAIEGR